jgi:SRSO17 transposase
MGDADSLRVGLELTGLNWIDRTDCLEWRHNCNATWDFWKETSLFSPRRKKRNKRTFRETDWGKFNEVPEKSLVLDPSWVETKEDRPELGLNHAPLNYYHST